MTRCTRAGAERGSVSVWMISTTTAAFLMIGLVFDGGVMLRARSDAFSAAAAAARAGAQQLDADAAVEGQAILDPVAAEQAVLDHLAARGLTGTATVSGDRVTVAVTATARLQLLRIVTGDGVTFESTATAEAVKVTLP